MAIIRVQKNQNYTTINNTALKDTRLSFKAKGLMAYMLSVPDDWKFYQSELTNRATDGVASIRSGLKELEKHGYLVRYQGRDEDTGEFGDVVWDLYEVPICENPISVNSKTGNPKPVNQTLLSTDELSTDELSTESKDTTSNLDLPSDEELKERFEEFWKFYPNKQGKKQALKKYMQYMKDPKDETTDEDILRGISAYNKQIEKNNTKKKYIKHGDTFFNNKSWEDDFEVGTTDGGWDDWDFMK